MRGGPPNGSPRPPGRGGNHSSGPRLRRRPSRLPPGYARGIRSRGTGRGGKGMARAYRYKEIQLAQLRGFCAVAVHGNFTAAAGALGVSASTVWEQVRALEKSLGTVLARHHGRGLELTPEGRLLYELVKPHVE